MLIKNGYFSIDAHPKSGRGVTRISTPPRPSLEPHLGGFQLQSLARGPMREDASDWVKEREDRRERRYRITMVSTIAAAIGAWLAALILLFRLF